MMHWKPGPKERGCIYHQRGVYEMAAESVLADVFVMPRIAARRPIAITVGRYRNYEAVAKRQWQITNLEDTTGAGAKVGSLFMEIGVPTELARPLGADVEALLLRDAPALRLALASLPRTRSSDSGQDDDDDIAF